MGDAFYRSEAAHEDRSDARAVDRLRNKLPVHDSAAADMPATPDVRHLPDAVFECRDLRSFHRLFVRLAEIQLYTVLLVASAAIAMWLANDTMSVLVPAGLVIAAYPALEYVLHRYLLHNNSLCRTPVTARVWWRIHYRHHAKPRDKKVILGAPWTLMVVVIAGALLAASIHWSLAGLAAAIAAASACVILYEYFHSFQHSSVETANPYLSHMRRHHLTHHYLNEQGNYGIATDLIDRLCRTVLTPTRDQKSPTVHNLGYLGDMERRYPYIADIERSTPSKS